MTVKEPKKSNIKAMLILMLALAALGAMIYAAKNSSKHSHDGGTSHAH